MSELAEGARLEIGQSEPKRYKADNYADSIEFGIGFFVFKPE